jgi:hypothetical protein
MTWQAIRELHPDQWLLLEVLEAESNQDQRHLKNMAVVERFPDSLSALRAYRVFKKSQPSKELVVMHTNRLDSTILQRSYIGIRGAA